MERALAPGAISRWREHANAGFGKALVFGIDVVDEEGDLALRPRDVVVWHLLPEKVGHVAAREERNFVPSVENSA